MIPIRNIKMGTKTQTKISPCLTIPLLLIVSLRIRPLKKISIMEVVKMAIEPLKSMLLK